MEVKLMEEEFLWPILNTIFIVFAFLYFLSGGPLTFLCLSLIFLPAILISVYQAKKCSFKDLIRSLSGALALQGMAILYIYLNKFSYFQDSTDYIAFYGLLVGFIITMFLVVYLYRRGDILVPQQ
jgi:hypothetical protein